MRAAPGWQRIDLRGRLLAVPPGIALDLGATAKAYAADLCADHVARELGVGVLLALGGDIATAGAGGDERWTVLVQDRPGDPAATVGLQSGSALATSSTSSCEWRRGAWVLHHIIDPRTCSPVPRVWRTVSVASHSCLKANTLTTAALVRGHAAVPWLREARVPARLVGSGGGVVTIGGWPKEATP